MRAVLIEPKMRVETTVPRECVDGVLFTLMGRRADVLSEENRGATCIVLAHVPAVEMVGYASELRVRTQGRATYTAHQIPGINR
jgi:elongation factor G